MARTLGFYTKGKGRSRKIHPVTGKTARPKTVKKTPGRFAGGSTYEANYRKLVSIMPRLEEMQPGDYAVLKAPGYMDLHVDVLSRDGDSMTVALAHNYIQNGDVMADPDMEVKVYPSTGMVEALTFQQANPPLYIRAYPAPGRVDPRARKQLNRFLSQWLSNLRRQGHREAR